ncbi:MAG: hypothetical protein R3B57_02580 [Phycisphaerales bacterium]
MRALRTGLQPRRLDRERLTTARRGNAMTGCLVVLAVVVVLVVGGVIFVAVKWRGWVASWGSEAAISFVEKSDLPDEEKAQVTAQIDSLATEFKNGNLTVEQMGEIFKALMESPLVPAAIVYGARTEYLNPSGLSDEEKEAGELALSRLSYGVSTKEIPTKTVEAVFEPIKTASATGKGVHINNKDLRLNLKPPEECTDEELREVIANAAEAADAAGVPETPPAIDVSDEIQKAIDKAKGVAPADEGAESADEAPAGGEEGP